MRMTHGHHHRQLESGGRPKLESHSILHRECMLRLRSGVKNEVRRSSRGKRVWHLIGNPGVEHKLGCPPIREDPEMAARS